jgi:RNA polymerase sigma-70 factor (ECF subfamily)
VEPPSDAALVAGLRRREQPAFDAVYARYHARIHRFLLRLSGRRDVAEDLFQEAWLSVARAAGDLAPDTDLCAWLFTVARNRYRSYRRWALLDTSRLAELALEPEDPGPDPDRDAAARAEAAAVSRAFDRLSPSHREVLLLAGVEGLEPARIGEVLGLRPDAVRQRLHRARAELAARLEKEDASLRPASSHRSGLRSDEPSSAPNPAGGAR